MTAVASMVVPGVPQSVARLRRHAVDACSSQGWVGDCDTVALLVSELATNAILHGSGDVRLTVRVDGSRLRVEVADASAGMPLQREASEDAEGGRGLALVSVLADNWGVLPLGLGKQVWFEVQA